MFSGYLTFAAANKRFISFGFLMAFASSFGQTYFIGAFGPAIRTEFDLSHVEWGSIYMLGTLASAAVLPFSGRYIDKLDLRHYAVGICLLMILACLLFSLISSWIFLVLGIFLLRQSGQGLMSHVSVTSMARYFDTNRGRAIAIATLGFAFGEAIWPILAVTSIENFGWRVTYALVAGFLALALIPTVLWLLVDHDKRHDAFVDRSLKAASDGNTSGWTLAEVLRDKRFYLMLPGITAPSIIMTAMFFHHLTLAEAKGWSALWMTGSYVVYSGSVVLTSLITGPLIDRLGASRIVPHMLGPLVLALVVVALYDNPYILWAYLTLAGIHVGIAHTAVSAMWAEVYGVTYIGAIKSLAAAVSVFASALGPVTVGIALDAGYQIATVCLMFAAYTVIGAVLLMVSLKRRS